MLGRVLLNCFLPKHSVPKRLLLLNLCHTFALCIHLLICSFNKYLLISYYVCIKGGQMA